jgi:hypothetical protein
MVIDGVCGGTVEEGLHLPKKVKDNVTRQKG